MSLRKVLTNFLSHICTHPTRQVAVAIKFYAVAPNLVYLQRGSRVSPSVRLLEF